jgi:hypothetical protein
VLANFPDATFHSASELTPQFLAEIDLLVLTAMSTERLPVNPLSESERTALRAFVAQGGCLIALLDNSSPFSSANQSIADPFGIQTGRSTGDAKVLITRPAANSVTSGRFGVVESFNQSRATGLTTTTFGQCLATNSAGCALIVIDFGEIGDDSGAAIFFSDVNTFVDDGEITRASFSANEALFLNAVDACATRQSTRRLCIGFDQFPDGTPININTLVTTEYQSFGVVFSSNDMTAPGMVTVNKSAVSRPNSAQAGTPSMRRSPRPPYEMTATFALPENPEVPAGTDFVAITTATTAQQGVESLIALDLTGNEVARTEVDFSRPRKVITLQTSEPIIHQVKLVTRGLIDDFCFAPVVEAIPPTVTVLTPNGSERLALGQPFTIRWTSTDNIGLASHDILLSTDGGHTFSATITSGLSGEAQSFDWTVPLGILTDQARIQVVARDEVGNAGRDASDADFHIVKIPPEIMAIQPSQAGRGVIADFRVIGMNLFAATAIEFTPSVGITVANPPRVNRDGTEAAVRVTIQPEAEAEPVRLVMIASPNGTSSRESSLVNTFLVLVMGPAYAQASPVSALFQSAALPGFAPAAPVSALFQFALGQGFVETVPVTALFQPLPSQGFAQSVPVTALFQTLPLPTQSFTQALPVSALFEKLPEQFFIQALPVSVAMEERLTTKHTKRHEEK